MEDIKEDSTEKCLNRILAVDRVEGYIDFNEDGVLESEHIETNMAILYAELFWEAAKMAKHVVRDLNPNKDLQFFRIKTKKKEFLATTLEDEIIMVIQKNPEP